MKINPLSLLLATVLAGCEQPKAPPEAVLDPSLVPIALGIADQAIENISAGPVGKYSLVIAGGNYNPPLVCRLDTQTGKAWMFVPATYEGNFTHKGYWKLLVED